MEHAPVMLTESIDGLSIKPGGIYVDGTLGRGGHTLEIAKRLGSGKIIAIDRDAAAISETSALLKQYREMITFVHGDFRDIPEILEAQGCDSADGMLFDLGVSSPQLDDAQRGFSYMHDAPLDMRMDAQSGLTAFDAVNDWSEEKLRKVFYEFGEERYAGLIARAIVNRRAKEPVDTTFDLRDIIIAAIPASARRETQHPAKRSFQALRIAVNNELDSLGKMLDSAPDTLRKGGRICVISFHSLEDRLVKTAFNIRASGCVCPKDFPVCVCGIKPTLRLITKKPVVPDTAETKRNPRARSAKLRIAERV